jgi:hypothetical protein
MCCAGFHVVVQGEGQGGHAHQDVEHRRGGDRGPNGLTVSECTVGIQQLIYTNIYL